MPVRYEFRLLGPVEVRRDGHAVDLGTPKQRRLLVTLLLHANTVVPVSRLIDAVWDGEAPASAVANLRTYAARLRRRFSDPDAVSGSRLRQQRPGYVLIVEPGELDLAAFEVLVAEARGHRDGQAAAAALFAEALTLWRGAAAADVERGSVLGALLQATDERHGTVLEELVSVRLALGHHAELVPDLVRHVTTYPLRERLWGQLMLARYRCGDGAGALATFGEARRLLAEQLGIGPGAELTALHRAILNRDPGLDARAGSLRDTHREAPRELPPDTPTFVDREVEVAAVRDTLRDGAVLVVHGPGGVGKSALAIRVAHAVTERFPDGQLYVDLHGATEGLRPAEPVTVLGRFLRALGVPAGDVPADQDEAAARFRSLATVRRLLVVLDNAADEVQVRPLLPAAAGCAVLITSRYALGALEASSVVPLGPLAGDAATTLLRRLCGDARVTAEPQPAAEVIRLCENLPLAVRIVGARLAAHPDRPLAALAAELRDERHRLDALRYGDLAVRSCFQVNYQSLADGPAALLFRLLGLLRVPTVTPPVAGALLDVPTLDAEVALDRLVTVRLLEVRGPGRYGMHDLLRLFAAEQLAPREGADAVWRALACYLSTVRRATDLLRPSQRRVGADEFVEPVARVPLATSAEAIAWLDGELPNLVAVARQAGDGEPAVARFPGLLASALAQYLPMRGRWAEHATLVEVSFPVAERLGDQRVRAIALSMRAALHRERGEYERSLADLGEVLALRRAAGDHRGTAATLVHVGLTEVQRGNLTEALACFAEGAALHREHGPPAGEGIARYEAGEAFLQLGSYEEALGWLRESLAIRRAEHDLVGVGISQVGLGKAYRLLGRYEDAVAVLSEAVRVCRETGNEGYLWQAIVWRGEARWRGGDMEAARADFLEARTHCAERGEHRGEAHALRLLGHLWTARGDPERAAACRRRAEALLADLPPSLAPIAPDDLWRQC